MIIKDVKVTLLRLPYREQPALAAGYDKDREVLVVEIETASGIVGLGYQLYLREGFRTTKACLEEMIIPRILGKDASAIEAIWRDLWSVTLADGRGGAPLLALSIIDVALWDIVGQKAGLPLHRLWGHYRSEVPIYGSGCWRGLGGDGMAAKAERFVSEGYKAIKMQVGHIWTDAEDVANVRLMRDTVGPDIDIMVDVNMAWTADKAILMGRKFEESEIYWLEEPVVPDDFHGYFRIADALDLRVENAPHVVERVHVLHFEIAIHRILDNARRGRDTTVVEIDQAAINRKRMPDPEPEVFVESNLSSGTRSGRSRGINALDGIVAKSRACDGGYGEK